jgi:hypothetical protein
MDELETSQPSAQVAFHDVPVLIDMAAIDLLLPVRTQHCMNALMNSAAS